MGAVVLIAAGVGTAIYPAIKRGGWWSFVPTRLLLALAPPAGQEWVIGPDGMNVVPEPVFKELAKRLSSRPLSSNEWDCLIKHEGVIKTRRLWPKNVPLAIGMREPRWMPLPKIIRLQPQFDGAQHAECGVLMITGLSHTYRWNVQSYQTLGKAAPGTSAIDARVTVLEPGRTTPIEEREIWSGLLRLPVTLVETMDEAIAPVRSPEVDAAVADAISLMARVERDDSSCIGIGIDRGKSALLGDMAFGVVIDILRDDLVVETLQGGLIYDGSELFSAPPGFPKWFAPARSLHGMANTLGDPNERKRWKIRVRGDGVASLRDWDRDRYWAGEMSFPMDSVIFLPGPNGGSYPRGQPDPE